MLDIPALHKTTVIFKIYANVHFFTCLFYTASRFVDYLRRLVSRWISLPYKALCFLCLFALLLWNLKDASIRANLVKIRRYIGVTSEPYFRQSCCSLNTEPQLSCSFQDAITTHPHAIFMPTPTPLPHLISPAPNILRYPWLLLLPIGVWVNVLLVLWLLPFVFLCVMIGHCESLFLPNIISSIERILKTFLKGTRLKINVS